MLKATELIIIMAMPNLCWVTAQIKMMDESEWIDPGDMINYDHNTQTMKNKPSAKSSSDIVETLNGQNVAANAVPDAVIEKCQTENSQLKMEITTLNQTVIAMKKQLSNCSALHEQTFFLQYVRVLITRFENFAASDDGVYQVDIKLTGEQYKYLADYAVNGQGSFQEVHSILLSMQQNSRWMTSEYDDDDLVWYVREYLSIAAQVICTVGTLLLLLAYCPRSVWWICSRLVLVSFLVSIPWNWWHLYKKEMAAKHARLFETMPEVCRSERQSFWNWVVSQFTIGTNECVRYYENLEIDPLWAVPPLKAVSVTIIKFFLEPVEHIGEAVNKLVVSAYGGLPFYMWIPVSILLIILILVIFGYRLRTLVFTIEPHNAAPIQAALQNLDGLKTENQLQERVAQLEMENRELRELTTINQLRNEDLEARLLHLTAGTSEQVAVAGALGEGDHRLAIGQEKYPVVCTDIVELSESPIPGAVARDGNHFVAAAISNSDDGTPSDAGSDFDHLNEL